jgi:hypothetical protein
MCAGLAGERRRRAQDNTLDHGGTGWTVSRGAPGRASVVMFVRM